MTGRILLRSFLPLLCLVMISTSSQARQYISVVGSSTVYPFATVVAERFGKSTRFATPKIESTGSGGGLKLFCAGIGIEFPDIANASRRIKASELQGCFTNGVNEVMEVQIGYDGIVLANSVKANRYSLALRDIYLALAKQVPNPDGSESLVANPYKRWNEVNPLLPETDIEVFGPPPTSGTRDAFVELAMEGGCKTFDWLAAIKKQDSSRYKTLCHSVREDGAYIEVGENDNLIVQKLDANPLALGIFGFSFLDQNADKVQGALIDAQEPVFKSIVDRKYPVSRPLYFYVKKAHIGVVPGIESYLDEFTADKAWGEEGYLSDKGMIPLHKAQRDTFAKAVATHSSLSLEDLK